jgi:pimeloyl-ACP methyl ester carboxylesterase
VKFLPRLVAVVIVLALVGGLAVAIVEATRGGSDDQSSPDVVMPTATAMPSTPAALSSYYDQKLKWSPCAGGRCAWLKVPLDYAQPDGKTVDIAVYMQPATDKKAVVGDLVVNPGGPGQSGIQYAAASSYVFRKPLTRHFNIVGFDPRGVGQSDSLKCWGTARMDSFLASDPMPSTLPELRAASAQLRAYGDSCLRNTGALARHMSTEDVVRDMDILRAALGQPRLDYFGASYGTMIGATYADIFPTHVGRMVLDGAMDPKLSSEQLNLTQAKGFEVALRSYIADCVKQGNCILGKSVDAGERTIQQLLAVTRKSPLPTNDPKRPLTEGLAVTGIIEPLYSKESWSSLTMALTSAIRNGQGSALLALADLYSGRTAKGYSDNSMNVLYNVNCLDDGESIPPKKVAGHFAAFEKASPTFGKMFASSLTGCAAWPIKSAKRPHAVKAAGAPPILVVGTTRDPATPLAWAEGLAKELESGVLVVRDGDGHTGYNQGNVCTDKAVENYLVGDKVPQDGLRC